MSNVPTALTRVVLLTVLLMCTAPAPTASAAPPPPEPSPTQCLQAFSADADYVGEGWPGALVTTASNGAGEFSLFCGDELSGVVHTAHPDSTGTGTVATVIVDDARRFAYTVFATGHQRAAANDWLGCAMQLA